MTKSTTGASRLRKAGSGLANTTTAAIEHLLADVLEQHPGEKWRLVLQEELRADRCGVDPEILYMNFRSLRDQHFADIVDATSQPPDHGGDIHFIRTDGTFGWIEIKAQTKKASHRDITQADFVRDGTSFLNRIYFTSEVVRQSLPDSLVTDLKLVDEPQVSNWTLSDLFLADLALVSDSSHRQLVGLEAVEDLHSFLEQKYFLQITQQGMRLVPFTRIPIVSALMAGHQIEPVFKTSNKNALSIQIVFDSQTVFTYHLGYANAPGRHKLHSAALPAEIFLGQDGFSSDFN